MFAVGLFVAYVRFVVWLGMSSLAVVENLDVVVNSVREFGTGFLFLPVEKFHLQG